MAHDEDDVSLVSDEECPGPSELESALTNDSLADVVTQAPLAFESNASLAQVIGAMQREHCGCALLVAAGRLVGILTERDVLMKVVGHSFDLERTEASACMTPEPITLPSDSTVAYAFNKMLLEGFRHIPLTDDDGRPVAVVSMRNLVEYLSGFFNRDLMNLPPNPRVNFRDREGA